MNNPTEMFYFSSRLWYNNRRVSKNSEASLYLQVYISGKHAEFMLRMRWPVASIDLVNGKLLPRYKGDPEVHDYNIIIEMERGKHNEINRSYRIRKEDLDLAKFKRELLIFDHRESFLKYIERETKRRYIKKEITKKTFQNVMATYHILKKFDPVCKFTDIKVKWMRSFKNFLVNYERKPGLKYSEGLIWTRMKDVKSYLELANNEPMLYVDQAAIDFPNPAPKMTTIFLNKDEIRRLMILHRDRSVNDMQYIVLGAFLFTCFTSLRISDLYRANDNWEVGAGYLRFIPKKNAKRQRYLTIPIMPLATQFIHNITGKYFTLPTEQEYNRTLKEIALLADIDKRLTSHVGRHTYGYLYMTTVGNIRGLQEILGHTKIETTERYAHLDEEYQLEAVRKIQVGFTDLVMRRLP